MLLTHVVFESKPIASVTYPAFTKFTFCPEIDAFTGPTPPQPGRNTITGRLSLNEILESHVAIARFKISVFDVDTLKGLANT